MPKVEQPELPSLEMTRFSAGPIPGKALAIREAVRSIEGASNMAYARIIDILATEIFSLGTKAIAEHSKWASEISKYKYLRDGDDELLIGIFNEGASMLLSGGYKKRKGKKNETKRG